MNTCLSCSLIKMVYAFCKKSGNEPTWFELKHAILRNFDGLDDQFVSPLELFEKHLSSDYNIRAEVNLCLVFLS